MGPKQAAGYLFEEEIRDLLNDSGFVEIKTETLEGRGTDHQIDGYGIYSIPVPFTYPIRIIAEAKCYERSIELPQVRSFFGVITDISENYFVKRGEKTNKIRYLDTGCFFSANNFTRNSQDFAWAHNIFLVSFSGINQMEAITKKILDYLNQKKTHKLRLGSKKELIVNYRIWKNSVHSEDRDLPLKYPTIVFGILDKTYPVVLVGDKDWNKRIKVMENTDKIEGEKHSRTPQKDGTLFQLNILKKEEFGFEHVCFTLPANIAENLIERIDQTQWGQKIFDLDIPVIYYYDQEPVRRIVTLEVILPGLNKRGYYEEIKLKPKSKRSKPHKRHVRANSSMLPDNDSNNTIDD